MLKFVSSSIQVFLSQQKAHNAQGAFFSVFESDHIQFNCFAPDFFHPTEFMWVLIYFAECFPCTSSDIFFAFHLLSSSSNITKHPPKSSSGDKLMKLCWMFVLEISFIFIYLLCWCQRTKSHHKCLFCLFNLLWLNEKCRKSNCSIHVFEAGHTKNHDSLFALM